MYIVLCCLQDIAYTLCTLSCFEPKLKSKYAAGCIILVTKWTPIMVIEVLAASFPQYQGVLFTFKPIVAIIIYGFVTILVFKGSTFKKALFILLNMVLDIVLDMGLGYTVFTLVMNVNVSAYQHNIERVLGTVVFLIFNIPTRYLFAVLWNKYINKRSVGKLAPLLLVPLSQLLTMACVEFLSYYPDMLHLFRFSFIIVSFVVCCVADIIFLRFINKNEKNTRLNAELREKEYMYSLEDEHYKSIEERRYEMAKIHHDLTNQINTAYAIIESNSAEARELLNEVRDVLNSTREYEYCGSAVVNAVISNKKKQCDDYGIAIDIDINIGQAKGITKSHLCSIFTNLLDNAINENRRILMRTDRSIKLKATKNNSYIVISVTNPVSADKTEKPKKDDGFHGYGLKIVEDIAKKYDGRFTHGTTDGIYSATVCICDIAPDENENA